MNVRNMMKTGWLVVLGMAAMAAGDDWPQWRGPDRTGISQETGWKKVWPGGAKRLWGKNVGTGASSVSVVGDRLWTMGNVDDVDHVWCLNARTGQVIWEQTYACRLSKRNFEGGTAATPTFHQGKVYTLSHEGHLYCFDAASGAVVWKKHLVKDFGGKSPFYSKSVWGYACSPLVVGDKVIVDAGSKTRGTTLALNKETGALIWGSSNRDYAAYASHQLLTYKGRAAVAGMNVFGLSIVDLQTGRELARMRWKTSYDVNASTPIVVDDNHLFLSSGYSTGGGLVDLSGPAPRELWHSRDMKTKTSTCVLYKGYLYGVDYKDLTCLDVKTGKTMWTEPRKIGQGTVMLADGSLIVMAEHGEIIIAPASPAGFKPTARQQVVAQRSWVVPVLANGVIYCKNNKGDLVALDVSP